MASQAIDYDALAKQHGAIVDYDALAAAHGAVQPQPEAAPASAGSRYFGSLVSSLNPFPALKRYVWDLPQAAQQEVATRMQSGDYVGAIKTAAASAPGVPFANDLLRAQVEQFRQAKQSAQAGDYSETFGHTLAGALPMVGPAAAQAGQQMGSGDVAGGLGTATGLLAPFAVAPAAKLVPASANTRVAEMLGSSAEKNWAKAINPTTKANKAIVQNVVAPGLTERGVVVSSLDSLKAKALAKMEESGQQIDDFMANHGSIPVQGRGGNAITSEIDNLIASKQRGGVTPQTNQAYVDALNGFKKDVEDLVAARGGTLTLEDARWLRQQYDATAASKNAFALPPAEQSRIAATADASNTLRRVIGDQFPDLAAANKEYSFWNRTHDVADATLTRRQGQKPPLTTSLAEAGGAVLGMHGGFGGAYAASKAAGILARLRNSTLWNSLSAQTKTQLGDLAESGDIPGMFRLAVASGAGLSPHSAPPTLVPVPP